MEAMINLINKKKLQKTIRLTNSSDKEIHVSYDYFVNNPMEFFENNLSIVV